MECKANKVTRRGFVAAATSGLALSSLAAGAALAEEAGKQEASTDGAAPYDAIVVGSGLSGLCTGVRLLEDGVKNVLIVTKEDTMGTAGNSRIAGGQFLFPMEDTDEGVQKMVDSFNAKSQGKGDAGLTQLVCANSKAANDWLVSHGCSFTDSAQVQPYDVLAVSAAPGGGKGMPDLMDQMLSEFEAAGGQELVSAKLVDLVMDEATGAVSGAKVRTADGVQELSAPQVVIATGGYLANKGFMQASCGADWRRPCHTDRHDRWVQRCHRRRQDLWPGHRQDGLRPSRFHGSVLRFLSHGPGRHAVLRRCLCRRRLPGPRA